MSYVGERLDQCRHFEVVSNWVEWVWIPNKSIACGHVMIAMEINLEKLGRVRRYFHVPGINNTAGASQVYGLYTEPHWMGEEGFTRYLAESKRSRAHVVFKRVSINLNEQKKIGNRLAQLMEQKWKYKLVVDNCQSFIEQLLQETQARLGDNTEMDCPGKDLNIPAFRESVRSSYWFRFVNFVMGY